MKISKEELISKGFQSIGNVGIFEILAKEVSDGEVAYFRVVSLDDRVIGQYAENVSKQDTEIAVMIKDKFF